MKPEIKIEGINLLSYLKTALKHITEVTKKVEAQTKEKVWDHFVSEGKKLTRQPQNFCGIDKTSKADCQLRKKAYTTKLTPEELKLLNKYRISTDKIVCQEESFTVNPEYQTDKEILDKVKKKISEIKDLPDDFFIYHTEELYSATSPKSIQQIFNKIDNPEELKTLLKIVSTIAIKVEEVDVDDNFIQVIAKEIKKGK